MSLKSQILFLVKSQGEASINELEELCRQERYKISNYERRARELSNEGLISAIKSRTKDGIEFISGYRAVDNF